jgi:hypothetical protein
VIAGNVSPIDVITHVPILCEEANVPYIYVPSKEVGSHFLHFIWPRLFCSGVGIKFCHCRVRYYEMTVTPA